MSRPRVNIIEPRYCGICGKPISKLKDNAASYKTKKVCRTVDNPECLRLWNSANAKKSNNNRPRAAIVLKPCEVCGEIIKPGANELKCTYDLRRVCRKIDNPACIKALNSGFMKGRRHAEARVMAPEQINELDREQMLLNSAIANRRHTAENFERHQWYQSWNR